MTDLGSTRPTSSIGSSRAVRSHTAVDTIDFYITPKGVGYN